MNKTIFEAEILPNGVGGILIRFVPTDDSNAARGEVLLLASLIQTSIPEENDWVLTVDTLLYEVALSVRVEDVVPATFTAREALVSAAIVVHDEAMGPKGVC